MKTIHPFKPQFSQEEIMALVHWFDERMDQLPPSLQLDDSCYAEDLPKVVRILISRMKDGIITPVWGAYATRLLLIKERLIDNGMVK